MKRAVALWVEVDGRRSLEALRRLGVASTIVIGSDASPVYGRPGERLCVRLDGPASGGRAGAGRAAATGNGGGGRAIASARAVGVALPVHAGAIVGPGPEGLAVLAELRGRLREPLAVAVRTPGELTDAAAGGADAAIVPDADTAAVLAEMASGSELELVVEVASRDAAEAALAAGANALLVPADRVAELLESPSVAVAIAPPSPAVRTPALGRATGRAGGARPGTIGAALDRAARIAGRGEAIVHLGSGQRWTYGSLRDDSRRIARAIASTGVQPGDRVAIWARNVPEWPLIQLACATIGAVLVTVNPSLTDDEFEFVLSQSGASLLIAAPRTPAQVALAQRAARGGRPHEARRVVLLPSSVAASSAGGPATGLAGSAAGSPAVGWAEFLDEAGAVTEAEVDRLAAGVQPDDVAMLLYTSGTTGFAKGAMLTHRGMLMNAAAVGANLRLGRTDRLCLAVPFHHCFGSVMGTLACLSYGSTMVVPGEWFDADATLSAIARERCTVIYGVPTMFLALLERPARPAADLASLRTGIVAGAPVALDLAERIVRDLHVADLVVAYGLTEASPVVTQTRPTDPPALRLGTVGRPIAGAEVRIVDADGGAVRAGEPGELVTRGPMVMRGYFDQEDETAATIDAAGWLHTGDLATRDERGYVRIVGRSKDLIIRGGENVYPAEIEAAGRTLDGIGDIAVVGVPSVYLGEEVVAFVRPVPGTALDEAALREHLARHLAPFKVPRWILAADEFPMTASGKVQKHVLGERALAALAGAAEQPGAGPSAAEQPGAGRSGAGPAGTDASAPALPLLAPKALAGDRSLGGPTASRTAVASPAAGAGTTPTGGTAAATSEHDASRPPRRGWRRPQASGWTWRRPDPSPESDTQEASVPLDQARQRGQRIKTWGIGGNVREQIEATGELPIMYRALGTPPQTRHPFNLYGDIRSQADALRGTFESAAEIAEVARRLAQHDPIGVLGLGSGTSQFVAQVADAAFARFADLPGWDYDSLAFLRYPPAIEFARYAVMAYSGSGSTVDTVAAARQSRDAGAFTVAFTSVEGSPVVQASDARILTSGGFDTGGSDTFHYTTRVAAAIYLALELGRIRRPGAHDYDALQRELVATSTAMAAMFDAVDARCRTIAEQFMDVRSILVVGAGANYGTAEEIALKFDEMAHIPTKAMNPGRHIHGALGLTEESILTLLVAPPGTSYPDMLSIAKVTQVLKTPAVAIVAEDDTEIADVVDYVIRIPAADESIFAVLAVLPGQLLPYWCGVGLGLNPDTQRSNVPKHARVWNMLFPPGTH